MNALSAPARRRLSRWAPSVVAVLALLFTLAAPWVASAQECGCTKVGPYKNPSRALPVLSETSPGGTYRVTTSQNGEFMSLTVSLAATGAAVETFEIPVARATWGFSPDAHRFLVRHAFPGEHLDVVTLYDLAADRQVYTNNVTSGATTIFSPHGRWFLQNVLHASDWAHLTILDAVTGETVLHDEMIFETLAGDPDDEFGTMGMGFSPDDADRSFVWAYRPKGLDIRMRVRNLEARANVVYQELSGSAWWKFSPCGDTLGIAQQNRVEPGLFATVYKTGGTLNQRLGTTQAYNPIPDLLTFETTLEHHRLVAVAHGSGETTVRNVGPNTADDACPPAVVLASLTASPASVVGGAANATGTVTLSGAARAPFTVSLSSSNTAAATVPSSVSVSTGQQSVSFIVTSKPVTASTPVTVTATAGSVSKTATVTVTPPPAALSELSVSPGRVMGGGPATGTVTLDRPAGPSGAVVSLQSSLADATVPASVTVPADATAATFPIATVAVPGDRAATIAASAGGISRSVRLTVLTPDRECRPGQVDPATQAIKSRAFAAYDDAGANADCDSTVNHTTGLTVGAGSTGLPHGAPVELTLALRFDGSLHTAPPEGSGGTTAHGSATYRVIEDVEPDPVSGRPELASFVAQFDLQQYSPGNRNVYEDQSWNLATNVGDPQHWDLYDERSSDTYASAGVDTGTVTATYATTVGAHLLLETQVSVVASAYGQGAAAVSDFSNTFTVSTTPAPGFEGLALAYDGTAPPPNEPPVCADGSGTTTQGTVLAASLACTDPEGAALAYTLRSGPSHGTVSAIGPDGSFTYTPAAGFTGTDSFSFSASDGTLESAVATYTVTVKPPLVGPPTSKDQCTRGGWKKFNNPSFRNQGECVSYVKSRRP